MAPAQRATSVASALAPASSPVSRAWLITRTHETADRRRVRVRLTDAGNAAFEQHAVTEEAGEIALLSALSAVEQRTLAELLRKLAVAAEAGQDVPAPAPHGPRRSRSTGC